MKLLDRAVVGLALSLCLVMPAWAEGNHIVSCDGWFGEETEVTSDFMELLTLRKILDATVEVSNGCFRVTYVNDEGHYVVESYDPISKKLVD